MRSLITGSNGLIGSFLTERLIQLGDEVCAVSRNSNSFIKPSKGKLKLSFGDITDKDFICSLVADFQPNRVFHLAAQSSPNISWENASKTFRVNIEGTYNILSAVNHYCKNSIVIAACSSAEYAQLNQKNKINERDELNPGSIYGISKLADYYLCRLFHRSKGLKVICARPFFVIGPRKVGDVCSDLARGIVKVERGEENKVKHGNLTPIRDFLDVRDSVNAFIYLSQSCKYGEVFNICSGEGISISNLLDKFCKLANCKIDTEIDDNLSRPIDEKIRVGDPQKLISLGWSKQYSLDDTVLEILNYWRKN